MIRPKIRFCIICGRLIPDYRNGNTKYCHDDCYDDNKAVNAAESYKKKAEHIVVLNNDEILHDFYVLVQSKEYVPAKQLVARNFNWSIHTGGVVINNIKAIKMIRYAYTFFENQTLIIWKL